MTLSVRYLRREPFNIASQMPMGHILSGAARLHVVTNRAARDHDHGHGLKSKELARRRVPLEGFTADYAGPALCAVNPLISAKSSPHDCSYSPRRVTLRVNHLFTDALSCSHAATIMFIGSPMQSFRNLTVSQKRSTVVLSYVMRAGNPTRPYYFSLIGHIFLSI